MSNQVYTDDTPMPFGKYKGDKMANVPAGYLIWLFDQGKVFGGLKSYLEENLDALQEEVNLNGGHED